MVTPSFRLRWPKGKQDYDKREDIKRRDQDREISRELGRRVKGINV